MTTEIGPDESLSAGLEAPVPAFENGDAPDRGAPGLPWNSKGFYPESPRREPGWGYTIGKLAYSCTVEQLRSQVARDRGKRIKLVWSPSSSHMVPPEEVPELLAGIRHRNAFATKYRLRSCLLIAVTWTALVAFAWTTANAPSGASFISYFTLPLVFGIMPAIESVWALRRSRARDYTLQDGLNAGQQVRYRYWLDRQRAPLSASFIAALLLVALVQNYASIQHLRYEPVGGERWSAVAAVGLVRSAVWEGEIWRLLTGAMLHDGLWHLLFNVLALYAFGRMLEVLVGGAYLPVVFLLSALSGGVLSLLLVPNTSLGSSGGIMGVLGFLVVLGYYNRPNLPPEFLKSMLTTVTYVAFFGLIAFGLTDNAAHAGGALCGALLAYILLPHHSTALPLRVGPVVRVLAGLSMVVLIATVLGSIVLMFTWP